MQFWIIQVLNSLALGGLLFLLASGFSLIFGPDAHCQSHARRLLHARRLFRREPACASCPGHRPLAGGSDCRCCGRRCSAVFSSGWSCAGWPANPLGQVLVTLGVVLHHLGRMPDDLGRRSHPGSDAASLSRRPLIIGGSCFRPIGLSWSASPLRPRSRFICCWSEPGSAP